MATLEEIEKELEDIPLTEHEWDMIEWLIDEVKRQREENEKLVKALAEISIEVKMLQKKLHPTVDREWEDFIKDTYEGRGGDDGEQTKPI